VAAVMLARGGGDVLTAWAQDENHHPARDAFDREVRW